VTTRSAIAAISVVAVAFGVSVLVRRGCAGHAATSDGTSPAQASGQGASGSGVATPVASSSRAVPTHAVKLASAAERAAIADDIAKTNAARAARHSVPPAPHLPDEPTLPPYVMDKLREAIPFVADCYHASDLHGDHTARVRFGLTSSPEVGTLIDPEQLHDGDDKPLDPGLEECVRGTLESLELPPLGSDGLSAKLEYSFDLSDAR
jgi:hypothetical protein